MPVRGPSSEDQPGGLLIWAGLPFNHGLWAPDPLLRLSPYQTDPYDAYAEKLTGTPQG